jgi:hypothetical protein
MRSQLHKLPSMPRRRHVRPNADTGANCAAPGKLTNAHDSPNFSRTGKPAPDQSASLTAEIDNAQAKLASLPVVASADPQAEGASAQLA